MQTPCKKSTIFTVFTRIYAVFPLTTSLQLPYHVLTTPVPPRWFNIQKKAHIGAFLWTCDGFYLVAYLSFRMKLPPTAIFCLIVGLPL